MGLGNTVDFKNTIIVMTSNIGAKHLQKREGLGFQSSKDENIVLEKMEELVKGEVKRTFNPEFLNRLDEIIIFTSLIESGPHADSCAAGRSTEQCQPGSQGNHASR